MSRINIQEKFLRVLQSFELDQANSKDQLKVKLATSGLDSIGFIHLIVALEEEFCFEFDDDHLNVDTFSDFQDMLDYISAL